MLEDDSRFPTFVKTVYGGRETCPTTGRVHFQGHVVCRSQQRFSAIKKWLPTAHIEPARNFNASIQYALKKDTASGDKTERQNATPYVTTRMAMEKLVVKCKALCECQFFMPGKGKTECHLDEKEDFWHRVRAILMDEPDLAGLYARPDIYRLWSNTKSVWIARGKTSYSITASLSSPPVNEIIFSLENTNASTAPQLQEEARTQSSGEEEGDESSTCSESST
jgi:hypothetical protein